MEEVVFFEYEDVKITNARFITNNQTYAMSSVTSVKSHMEKPSRNPYLIAILLGICFIVMTSYVLGLIIIAVAVYFIMKQEPLYTVILKTSSGENRALQTHQQEYLNKVINALNEAIVHRG